MGLELLSKYQSNCSYQIASTSQKKILGEWESLLIQLEYSGNIQLSNYKPMQSKQSPYRFRYYLHYLKFIFGFVFIDLLYSFVNFKCKYRIRR